MSDGTVLLADHYYSRRRPELPPSLCARPMAAPGLFGVIFARPFAVHGFQVLIQSCRGTFGSGGEFNAFRNEQSDGLDTLEWLKTASLVFRRVRHCWPELPGPGAVGHRRPSRSLLKAMGVQVTSSDFRSLTYPGKSLRPRHRRSPGSRQWRTRKRVS